MFVRNDREAGTLISKIRRDTGLTQTELARRTGIQRSVLSAYERGHRQPSATALARIARAAGLELTVAPASDEANLVRSGRILKDVLDFAEAMPTRKAGELTYPALIRLNR